ncbi:MAG: hypothetical protein HY290_29830 [Planctomycetia bacterium]|nr:hypothetical protein [Planctomycetia bacterium]
MPPAKRKSDDKPAPPDPSAMSRVFRALYRPLILVTAALVALTGLMLPRLKSYLPDLSQRSEYQLPASAIEITQPPQWVPRDLVHHVVEDANLPEKLSLLDDSLVQDVAQAFRLNPWVEEVVSVTKSYPAKMVVVLQYRRPVAMVEVKSGQYPIDSHGVLLPPQDFSLSDSRSFPLITGVTSTPQGPAGTAWGDKVVEDAAALAAELGPYWKKLGLASIICPATSEARAKIDEGVFVLLAKGGSRIVWGHAPGIDHPGELSTKQRLGRLEDYVKRFGGFDRPQGPYQIDIRHWRDISRTPLSAQHDWLDTVRE